MRYALLVSYDENAKVSAQERDRRPSVSRRCRPGCAPKARSLAGSSGSQYGSVEVRPVVAEPR